jgi:hypothetical protein
MTIIEMNMVNYLGRGIKVYKKDGQFLNFKPMSLVNDEQGERWVGFDDEMNERTIKRNEIEFIQ